MSDRPVFVAALWSEVHNCWAEFVVSPDSARVLGVVETLTTHCPVHIRVVRVARDDWDVIGPALNKLSPPPPAYTAKELEVYCAMFGVLGEGLELGADGAEVAPLPLVS